MAGHPCFRGKSADDKNIVSEIYAVRRASSIVSPCQRRNSEAEHAEGFEAKLDDMIPSAYIVDITEYTVRPVIRQAEEERLDLT